jgi:hypothetical protein
MSAQADTCAVPSNHSGEPYTALAGVSKAQLQLLLNEYMFMHRWTRHSEAISAGFRPGSRVYGQVLKSGGRFDPKRTSAWRSAYAKSGRPRFLAEIGPKLNMVAVDRAVVDWVVGVCLASGLWSEVKTLSDCRFVFTAGLTPDGSRSTVQPRRFEVRGGRCGPWPDRPLSAKGDAVQCVRSGGRPLTLELTTDRAGVTRQALPALAQPDLPPEPLQQRKPSEPVSEVFRLWRSRDFRLQQLGRGCPSCELYAADIRPSAADAVILQAATVSSSGGGWRPCPAEFRCGVYEFSPADNPRLSGCADVPVCRVWRLAETTAEASDVIQLTYRTSELQCANCPGSLDFEIAHKQWQALRDSTTARCDVLADLPAQAIGSAAKH